MDTQRIIEFIDEWLDENGWRTDSRVLDLALDVRSMVDELESGEREHRTLEPAA